MKMKKKEARSKRSRNGVMSEIRVKCGYWKSVSCTYFEYQVP